MTPEEQFIHDNIIRAFKNDFKIDAVARIITEMISENMDIKFKDNNKTTQ